MPNRPFGSQLRALREARNLTQDALAKKSNLSVDAIRRLERDSVSPSLSTLNKLTNGLQISLRTLFQNIQDGEPTEVAEIEDYLARKSPAELLMVTRVLRALFEER